ncbi:MAG: S1 family peptidase [Phycisphaerales bacterium]
MNMQWRNRSSQIALATLGALALAAATTIAAAQSSDDDHRRGDPNLREELNRRMTALEQAGALQSFPTLPHVPPDLFPDDLPVASADALSGPDLYERVCSATVMFHTSYQCSKCSKWHGGVATGFVIHPDGWIVTAAHVVNDLKDTDFCAVMLCDEVVYPVTGVYAVDDDRDTAIVKIDAHDLPALPLAHAPSRTGAAVSVVSHPQGHFYLLTQGVIARVMGGEADADERLQITAEFATGSSGAPVVDAHGNVIGMALATRTLYADEEDHDNPQLVIRMCVPVDEIRALLPDHATAADASSNIDE